MTETNLTTVTGNETVSSEADSGWKEAIEIYFKQFLSFFFPTIYDEIDLKKGMERGLKKGYEFLDKELEKVVRKSESSKRFADKLIKVYLMSFFGL